MQPPTAGDAFIVLGSYREAEPPERLVYARRWEPGPATDESEPLLSVEFIARGDETELVLAYTDFRAGHGAASSQMGWEGDLDTFEALLREAASTPEVSSNRAYRLTGAGGVRVPRGGTKGPQARTGVLDSRPSRHR